MSGEKVLFPDAIISELSSSWRHGFSCIRLPQVLWLRHQTFFLLGSQHWGKAVLWGSEGFNRGETRGLEVQLHPGSSSFNWVWGADGTPGSCSFYGSRRHLVDEPRQVLAEQFLLKVRFRCCMDSAICQLLLSPWLVLIMALFTRDDNSPGHSLPQRRCW